MYDASEAAMLATSRPLTSANKRIAPMKAEIPTPEQLRNLLRYDPDTGKLFWKSRNVSMFNDGYRGAQGNCNNWNSRYSGKEACNAVSKGYLIGGVLGKRLKAHRIAWAIHYGKWPTQQIDHINGKRNDNRIKNLRDVSAQENQKNMKKSSLNNTGHSGVHAHNGRWRVKIQNKHVGIFTSLDEAVRARKEAESLIGFHSNHGR